MTLVASSCGGMTTQSRGVATQSSRRQGPVTLQVMNFANYMPEDIAERFKEATGHSIELTLTSSNEDALAKLDASPEGTYDVAFLTSPFAEGLIKAGALEPLDHAKLPNLSNLYPEATQLAFDEGTSTRCPTRGARRGSATARISSATRPIDSWNDLLDPSPALAGKITMLDEDRWILMPALKTLGYSVNTTNPDELAAGEQTSRSRRRQSCSGYDAETFYTKLDSGEAVAVMGWDGWCNYVADTEQLGWALPEEGSDLWADMMVIPKGSARLEAAHEFIDFLLEVENGQWVAENILYKVPNQAAMEALDPALLETYPNMAMSPADLLAQETAARPRGGTAGLHRRRDPSEGLVIGALWVRMRRTRLVRRGCRGRRRCFGTSAHRWPRTIAVRPAHAGARLRLVGVFLLAPIGLVLVSSFFRRGPFGGVVYELTGANYTRAIDPLYLRVLWYSVRMALIATVICVLIGYPAASFIATRPSARARNALLVLVILPFWTNFLIRTYSWIVLLNREGVINRSLISLGVIDGPLDLLYNDLAIVLGLVYGYLPLMILPMYAALERLNPEVLEAAQDLGVETVPRSPHGHVAARRARNRRGVRVRLRAEPRQLPGAAAPRRRAADHDRQPRQPAVPRRPRLAVRVDAGADADGHPARPARRAVAGAAAQPGDRDRWLSAAGRGRVAARAHGVALRVPLPAARRARGALVQRRAAIGRELARVLDPVVRRGAARPDDRRARSPPPWSSRPPRPRSRWCSARCSPWASNGRREAACSTAPSSSRSSCPTS